MAIDDATLKALQEEAIEILREDYGKSALAKLRADQDKFQKEMREWRDSQTADKSAGGNGPTGTTQPTGIPEVRPDGNPVDAATGAPQPPPVIPPEQQSTGKPKRKSIWWGDALSDD